jgi:hypothetical protein
MKTRATAILGSTLILSGALFLTSCDNIQLPQTPSVEEQDGAENQDEGTEQQDDQDEGTDQQDDPDEGTEQQDDQDEGTEQQDDQDEGTDQ